MTTVVVLLNPEEPDPEIVAILSDPAYIRRVQYVKGQEISFHSLKKVSFRESSGCFILSSRLNDLGRDPRIIDAEVLMRVMSLKKFAPHVPLYVSVTLPTNRIHFTHLADHALCLEELKLGLLAANTRTNRVNETVAPGFSTILIHLTISLTEESIQRHLDANADSWAEGYAHSVSQEIYPVSLSVYRGMQFSDIVVAIYHKHHALLIGVCNEAGNVLINPREQIIDGTETGYVITRDAEVASEIASGVENATSVSRLVETESGDPSPSVTVPVKEELVYKGRKGKGKVHETTLMRMSPPLPTDASPRLKIVTPSSTFDSSLQTNPKSMNDHIIICYLGTQVFPKTLVHFVKPYRKQSPNTPIVILASTPPSETDKELLSEYGWIYYVTGSGFVRGDLDKCGVATCAIAVVTGNNRMETGRSIDSSSLVVVLNIEALSNNSDLRIVMDLIHTENIKFVGGNDNAYVALPTFRIGSSDLFSQLLNPSFASGHVFSQSLLNSLIASTYYNPYLLKLIDKLVFPTRNKILHIKIDREYDGMTWSTVFEIFLKKGIPLALYKYREGTGGYYVSVNPRIFARVSSKDKIIMIVNVS